MFCYSCGQEIDNNSQFCLHCGAPAAGNMNGVSIKKDGPSFGFALLGFFLPVVGLIIYLVMNDDRPQKAKSAGKGALVGVITSVVTGIITGIIIAIICCITIPIAILGIEGEFDDISDESFIDIYDEYVEEDEDMSAYADIKFGEFTAEKKEDGSTSTALSITVTNKSDEKEEFFITVEAWKDGTRIGVAGIYVDELEPGKSARVKAFEDISDYEIEDFKNAEFKVASVTD